MRCQLESYPLCLLDGREGRGAFNNIRLEHLLHRDVRDGVPHSRHGLFNTIVFV